MRLESPCYQCPKHQLGCRTGCEEWDIFETANKERYAEKVKNYKRLEVVNGYKHRKIKERVCKEHLARRK